MNYLKQSWLVIVLALGFGVALAFVQTTLSPRIKQNMLDLTLRQIPTLVPGAVGGAEKTLTVTTETQGRKIVESKTVYVALDAQKKRVGWVVKGRGLGFADAIEVLIGLDHDANRITGLYVLDQKETPGLGNKIEGPEFTGKFAGASTQQPVTVVKAGASGENEIDAIGGATVSSESVAQIVNATVQEIRPLLVDQGKKE